MYARKVNAALRSDYSVIVHAVGIGGFALCNKSITVDMLHVLTRGEVLKLHLWFACDRCTAKLDRAHAEALQENESRFQARIDVWHIGQVWDIAHAENVARSAAAPAESAAAPARTVAPASAISPRTLRPVAPALALLDHAHMIARKHGRNWAKRAPGHSPTLGKRLAAWYELQLTRPRAVTPEIVALWSRLGAEVDAQWEALTACIDVTVTATDPYACAEELFADLDRGRMNVFSTASTGGHPVWTNGQNDRFRAVHDVFGHYLNRVTFDRNGEDAAYRSHRSMFSTGVLPALACELRAQTSVLCYGSLPGTFRDQIAVPVPAEFIGDDMQVNRWVFPID